MKNIDFLQETNEIKVDLDMLWDNFFNISIKRRKEIVKKEINDIMNEWNKKIFTNYIEDLFLELFELNKLKNPETYNICAKTFNYILRKFIESKKYRRYLLSWKKWTEMYLLREEIVTFISEFIDKDIIKILLSKLEKKIIKKKKKQVDNDYITQKRENEMENIYDPDNLDSFF